MAEREREINRINLANLVGLRARSSSKQASPDLHDEEEECRPWRRRLTMSFSWASALRITILLLLLAAVIVACFTLPIEKVPPSLLSSFFHSTFINANPFPFRLCRWWRTSYCGSITILGPGAHSFCTPFFLSSLSLNCFPLTHRLIDSNFWICLVVFRAVAYIPLTVLAVPASVLTVRAVPTLLLLANLFLFFVYANNESC